MKPNQMLVFFVLLSTALLGANGLAELRFVEVQARLEGLPAGFRVESWTVADLQGTGRPLLVLHGIWPGNFRLPLRERRPNEAIFVLAASRSGGKVVHSLGEQTSAPALPGGQAGGVVRIRVDQLHAVDIDRDGRDELWICRGPGEPDTIARWRNGKLVQEPAPTPDMVRPRLLWGDFNGDGYTDLLFQGAVRVKGRIGVIDTQPPVLWMNREGTLERAGEPFSDTVRLNEAHVIDFNEDGRSDLLLGSPAQPSGPPTSTVWLSIDGVGRDDPAEATTLRFEPIPGPLCGGRPLPPVAALEVVGADLTGDGLRDFVVSGIAGGPSGDRSPLWLGYAKKNEEAGAGYCLQEDPRLQPLGRDTRARLIPGDLDADGDIDLLGVGGEAQNKSLIWIENEGGVLKNASGAVEDRGSLLSGLFSIHIVPFDFDGDGQQDFLCFPDRDAANAVLLMNRSRPASFDARGETPRSVYTNDVMAR
ncbi:MAG: VCBS repeat-containing protein [Candidatus Brocadiia bacterium]